MFYLKRSGILLFLLTVFVLFAGRFLSQCQAQITTENVQLPGRLRQQADELLTIDLDMKIPNTAFANGNVSFPRDTVLAPIRRWYLLKVGIRQLSVDRIIVADVLKLNHFEYPGKPTTARAESAVTGNEHNLMGLELEDGRRIVLNQIAGAIARRIVCEPDVGTQLARGQRFGMIKLGSRVELYLPLADGYEIAVRRGARVKAGQTVLASRLAGPAPQSSEAA